jgi:hypothetical protein
VRKTSSLVARIAWISAAAICLFTAENIWIDAPLVRRSHHRLPSFVPEALGGMWFMAFLALAIGLVLAVFCLLVLLKDAGVAGWKKALTGTVVLAAAILSGEWFVATGGMAVLAQIHPHRRDHPVVLHWEASTSPNVRYNVYRGSKPGIHPAKVNSFPIDGVTFTDTTAENHTRYYYVARAIDGNGRESSDSNETFANVP